MKKLSERICLIFDKTGLSQTDFATSIGVSDRTLRAYLQDVTKPSAEAIANIAALYNVNCNWLLLEEGPIYRSPSDMSVVSSDNNLLQSNPIAERRKLLDKIESMQETIDELIKSNNKLIQKYITS